MTTLSLYYNYTVQCMLVLLGAEAPQRYAEPLRDNQLRKCMQNVHVPFVSTVHATEVKCSTCIASAAHQ